MTLDRKLKHRNGLRTFFGTIVKNVEAYLEQEEVEAAKLTGHKNTLLKVVEDLSRLDDEVSKMLDPEHLSADVVESMELVLPAYELEAALDIRLSEINKVKDPPISVPSHSVSSFSNVSKLPKIELPVFKGDPLQWQGFWDQFQTSIHHNERISDIDRFNFLKRYLSGEALSAIAGFTLSSENYKEAIALLCDRYGNEQALISAHMQSLLDVKKIKSKDNIKGLRNLYNYVESCVRNLKSLKLDAKGYGSLLIPLLKEKLPDDFKIVISRKFGSSVWTLDVLLGHFNEELRAQENCIPIVAKTDRAEPSEIFSASGLHFQTENQNCAFCDKTHASFKCRTITNILSRKSIVRRKGLCFICLGKGHTARDCKMEYLCKKCGGRHNISICGSDERHQKGNTGSNGSSKQSRTFVTNQTACETPALSEKPQCSCNCSRQVKPPELSHSACAQLNCGVLMQTATGKIFGSNSNFLHARLLFDTGSQRSYISKELCSMLGLKPIRQENVIIKTFGESNKAKIQCLDVVRFRVKHREGNTFSEIEALAVPEICSPIANQHLNEVRRIKEFFNLELADHSEGSDLSVNVLIGLDFYFQFFTGKRINSDSGMIASESLLGWVVSGSFKSHFHAKTTQSHHMRIEVNKVEDIDLNSTLHKFWKVEETGSSSENCVVTQFVKDIFHDGDRYVTKLPFKPEHESIPDNFSVCQRRLNSLENKLGQNGIMEDYNNIFLDYEKNGIIERVPDSEVPKDEGTTHYLPHRPIIREDKTTTKIRAVFDASCNTSGVSLNECLYSGPNLLAKIFDILLRFRLNKIGILADIKQAFLNVSIHRDHQDYLRFLWRDLNSSDRESHYL